MNIPKEAIEAAADEIDDAVGGGTDEGWADRTARAALEAAAPLLMAQAWDEGAKAMMRAVSEEQSASFIAPNNPYRP